MSRQNSACNCGPIFEFTWLCSGGNDIVNSLDTLYTLTLKLERTAANVMNVTFSIADTGGVISTHSITDDPDGTAELGTGPISTTFEQLFFRFSDNTSTADAIDLSRIKVEHIRIPEPTSLTLIGLGGSALVGAACRHR